ncbi:hypothetical protein [Photobacterium leiognathi]|uniref:hypothetical protein n=1 Tax=Photobacterium leiognathi TaxID=553611 RepID=UPI002982B15D|nr:hypothetical protein [Photobacterium leiognathi]
MKQVVFICHPNTSPEDLVYGKLALNSVTLNKDELPLGINLYSNLCFNVDQSTKLVAESLYICDKLLVFIDRGIDSTMLTTIRASQNIGLAVQYRTLSELNTVKAIVNENEDPHTINDLILSHNTKFGTLRNDAIPQYELISKLNRELVSKIN